MLIETLCTIPAKPRNWVWTGVIPDGQLSLLIGKPGVGKSMVVMDVIARATRGPRFHGRLSKLAKFETIKTLSNRELGQ
jgi:ABC-type uncharacterized transport system ATPase subunit